MRVAGLPCRVMAPGEAAGLVRSLNPGPLGRRLSGAVLAVHRLAAELARRGYRVLGVVLFGSAVEGRAGPDSDVDAYLLYEGDSPEGELGRLLPAVVRLKEGPGGVEAHTQLLDVENGVLLHVIPLEPGEAARRLSSEGGECVYIPLGGGGGE